MEYNQLPEKRLTTQKTAKTQHGKFNVLNNDYIGKTCLNGEHYEYSKIKRVLKYLQPGDIAIDIGANCGMHTIPYAKKVGITGEVHCFEPQSVMVTLLKDNVLMNVPDHKVFIHHMAVGHINSNTTMKSVDYRKHDNFGGLSLGTGGEKIPMKTIDSFNYVNIRLIKIDVEGAEPLVIWGAKQTIERCFPIVYYEKNQKKITDDMIKMFKLSKEIRNFNIKDYLTTLGYSFQKKGVMILALPPPNQGSQV